MTLDERLQQWTVAHRVEPLDPLALAVSYAGSFGLVWVGLALALALVRRQAAPLLLTVAAVALADLAAIALKAVIERPRPYAAFPEQEPLVTSSFEYSLPSGHAATSAAGAAVLAAYAPRLAPALVVLAAAVAWSRVYVGVHFPADVVAGGLLGLAVAAALLVVARAVGPRALRSPGAGRRRSRPAPPPG
ncbi:MAG: phosphatase PAP2 family protein [Thermoleophilia bacterium]|nr:phosphatase PAP2 family protein [Thermoleophilia bacterium]